MANQADPATRPLFRHVPPTDLDRTPRSSKLLRKIGLFGLLVLALPALGCISAPTPAQWLAAGDAPFRTTEGTFEAFKTATAGDNADLGYRCLSAEFRRTYGITQITYRVLRDRFPYLKYLSKAEVLESTEISPTEIEYLCKIEVLFKTARVRIGFTREDFFDVYRGNEPLGGDVQPFEESARQVDAQDGQPGIGTWVPLPAGLPFDQVTEVRVGREWKINSIELEDAGSPPAP